MYHQSAAVNDTDGRQAGLLAGDIFHRLHMISLCVAMFVLDRYS